MNSIRKRLTLYLLVVIAVLALVANFVLYYRVRMVLKRQYDEALLDRAGALSHLIAWDVKGQMMLEIPDKSLDEFNRAGGPDYMEVLRPDNSVFLRTPGLKGQDISGLPASGEPGAWYLTLPDGRPGRATSLRFVPHHESDEPQNVVDQAGRIPPPEGEALLVLASDMNRVENFLGHLIEGQVAATILLAAFSTAAVLYSIRRSLEPLQRLGDVADALPTGLPDWRFSECDMPVELTPIVRRLNDLLSRTEIAFQRERRFTANVAHELRTPIAELRTLSEVALASPYAKDGATQDFEETLAIARQMQTVVESLLAIARAEVSPRATLHSVELEPIVDAALKPFRAAMTERGLSLACQIDPGEAATDPMLLEPLLRNLVSNAVNHAPPSSAITVTCRALKGQPRVTIANDAPGLTVEDLPYLTEPFWRKDAARTEGEHVGLGLPVAVAYAAMLGLKLIPALEGGRLQMTIRAEAD